MIETLLQDKTKKAKAKVSQIGNWLLDGTLPIEELMAIANEQTPVNKANCIEAIEYATKKKPMIADETVLNFIGKSLNEDEPRIKWESAKVMANIAKFFPTKLAKITSILLTNASHEGTVVRWATATAFAEILNLKTKLNSELIPKIDKLAMTETDNAVKKKYQEAMKKVKK